MEARFSEFGIFAFAEHHLHASDKLDDAGRAVRRLRLKSVFHPAVPADDISKYAVGTKEWYAASHAGVCFAWHPSLRFAPVDPLIIREFLPTPAHQSRVVAGVLRLRKVSILLIEVYLVTGVGLVDVNLQLLDAIRHLVTLIGLPVVIVGGFSSFPCGPL